MNHKHEHLTPFHLAIPVSDLEKCRTFYREILKCEEGRSSSHWVDFNFFGHQLVLHVLRLIQLFDGYECDSPYLVQIYLNTSNLF